jgi:hypothetical protein
MKKKRIKLKVVPSKVHSDLWSCYDENAQRGSQSYVNHKATPSEALHDWLEQQYFKSRPLEEFNRYQATLINAEDVPGIDQAKWTFKWIGNRQQDRDRPPTAYERMVRSHQTTNDKALPHIDDHVEDKPRE